MVKWFWPTRSDTFPSPEKFSSPILQRLLTESADSYPGMSNRTFFGFPSLYTASISSLREWGVPEGHFVEVTAEVVGAGARSSRTECYPRR